MNTDEFAFLNQQLAAMLRDGIPLEGALHRLSAEMRDGRLRGELQALEADLAKGTPIPDALSRRQLPELYKRMVVVGVKSGDLPGALTMLADYFQRQSSVLARLKSMLVYPLIVLFAAFLLSVLLSFAWSCVIGPSFRDLFAGMGVRLPAFTLFAFSTLQTIWAFPLTIAVVFLACISILFIPALRDKLMWRLPAFKEATVSRIASSINLLLKNGVSLPEAIAFTEELETSTEAAADLRRWRQQLSAGTVKFSEVAAGNKLVPPLFTWIVSGAGENVADGFRRASDIYHARALYRTEVALYSVLPMTSLFLGGVILSLGMLVLSMFLPMIAMLNNLSGG